MLSRPLGFAILLSLFVPTLAQGQIVNTLRGFADDEDGWAGSLDGYFDISEGNTVYREYGGAFTLQFLTGQHRIRALASGLRKESRGELIAESSRVHLRHNYWFAERWASIAYVQDSRNPFQRLESRFLLGAGARFDAIRGEGFDAYLGLTTMLEREVIQDDPRDGDLQHRMSSFLSLLYDLSERTQIDLVAFYQPRWDDFSNYRTVVSSRLKVEIVGSLYFSLNYEFQKQTRPPAGVGPTDWNLLSGIGWGF